MVAARARATKFAVCFSLDSLPAVLHMLVSRVPTIPSLRDHTPIPILLVIVTLLVFPVLNLLPITAFLSISTPTDTA